ncbi:MAG: tetratricopeptide repeat protein [Candidatus Eiseniibacteriota bacterium]
MARADRRPILAALLSAALLSAPRVPAAATDAAKAAEADSLHRHAVARLAEGSLDARRLALSELERASRLDPGRLAIWLDLGRLCLETGRRLRGRSCYERASRVAPDDAEAHLALGMAWTWEWLGSFEDAPLARAQQSMARATELAPGRADAWGRLSALELARGRVDRATLAARRGLSANPRAWEPMVAFACASYRAGAAGRGRQRVSSGPRADAGRARLAFRRRHLVPRRPCGGLGRAGCRHGRTVARPGPDDARERGGAGLRDPPGTGPAAVPQDVRGLRWDMRTELFLRYGPPAMVEINPVSGRLAYQHNRYQHDVPPDFVPYTPDPIGYPHNVQAWYYPELGIRAELWDRSLTQSYQLPVALESDADPRPNPRLLASRSDLVSLGEGRGVYRAMAPGSRPIPAQGHVARFPSGGGAVLAAHLRTAGDPSDTLRGAWAMVDSSGHVLARGSGRLSTSSCDPTGRQVADYTAAAPPGAYRVDLSASGSDGRRGLVRLAVTVPPASPGLALSDLVLLCGLEGASVGPGTVRIEPDMARRVEGSRPLTVYFEIDRLALGGDGQARFAYTTSVVPVKDEPPRKRTAPAAYQASREESHDGTRRRQFVTIPVRAIQRGRYDLRIEVRDLVAGTRAEAEIRFERE